MWLLAALVGFLVLAAVALQLAIWRNGPAVLNSVDRIVGGHRATRLLANEVIGDHAGQKILVHGPATPSGDDTRPVILFVHGGSWNKGDPDDYDFIARAFVPKGFVVALAGYRLHPEVEYPAMLEDTAAAIAWTHSNIAKFGGDPRRIVLAGHSAGAYNVVMAALEPKWLSTYGISAKSVAGVVGLAGPYDFYPWDSDSTRASFGKATNPEATQPVNHTSADAPPLLLIHGENDTLVKPRNSRALAEKVRQAGGRVETLYIDGMDHNRVLLALAAPWRDDPKVLNTVTLFAERAIASVPVQGEIR